MLTSAHIQRTGITVQMIVSLLFAAVLVAIFIGEFDRRSETNRMIADLSEQANISVSLLSGLMIESIIVEDTPVLETAMQEAITRNPKLLSVAIFSEEGKQIATAKADIERSSDETRLFRHEIDLDGMGFGAVEVLWSTREGQAMIESGVRRTQITTMATVAVLSALFLLLTHVLAMRPLQFIHARMAAAIERKPFEKWPLPAYVSRELRALNESVDVLEKTLSERDDREAALETARKNADMASKAKSDFLANMSHEIRTPMNGVIGMVDLLLETNLSEDQKLYAGTISTSGKALLAIINDILDFSKIEAGKIVIDKSSFNLSETVLDVATLLSVKADEKGVKTSVTFAPGIPNDFLGDVGKVRQVLTNIVGNAVKFTAEGSVNIHVDAHEENGTAEVVISVSDTGVGIPQDNLEGVFSAFEQVDSKSSRAFEGTGLGLAISRRLTRLMGGEVSVQSTRGKGSTFTIRLNLPISYSLEKRSEKSPRKILLVKKDSTKVPAWGKYLEEQGVAVRCCTIDDFVTEEGKDEWPANELDRVVVILEGNCDIKLLEKLSSVLAQHHDRPMNFLVPAKNMHQLKNLERNQIPNLVTEKDSPRDTADMILNCHTGFWTKSDSLMKGDATSRTQLKLLVAEDNKTNQVVVKHLLKSFPIQITFADSGVDAVKKFGEIMPDFVFMDMSMPGMDGLEATRQIRQLERSAANTRCPIVALTANAQENDRKRCEDVGMDGFVTKPITKQALSNVLREWGVRQN